MNPFTTLSIEMHERIFSFLSEKETDDLQYVSLDFHYLSQDDVLWKNSLKKMQVKKQRNQVKAQVTALYLKYILCLQKAFGIHLESRNIFELKNQIDVFIKKNNESEKMCLHLTSIFNTAIQNAQFFIPHLLFPLIPKEWKNYALTEATKRSFKFVPRLLKMGGMPNPHSFHQAIKNCPQYVVTMLKTGFKPETEHLTAALIHKPSLLDSLIKKGTSPDLHTLEIAARYRPEYVKRIASILKSLGIENDAIQAAIERGHLRR